MNSLVLDLRPLTYDREDEEAEDEHREAELESEAHALATRRAGPHLGAQLADAVKEGLLALFHVRSTLVMG